MNELGSAGLSEAELADRMERCVYPNGDFHHLDHLRLAWHYLRILDEESAIRRMQETICRFATSLGHPEKYHVTITVGWMRLVAFAMLDMPKVYDFSRFIGAHSWLCDPKHLQTFYSAEVLNSQQARLTGISPDLQPLP